MVNVNAESLERWEMWAYQIAHEIEPWQQNSPSGLVNQKKYYLEAERSFFEYNEGENMFRIIYCVVRPKLPGDRCDSPLRLPSKYVFPKVYVLPGRDGEWQPLWVTKASFSEDGKEACRNR